MVDDNELKRLGGLQAPAPSAEAKARALAAAMQAFDEKNIASASQGSEGRLRLTDRAQKIWREMMQKKLLAAPALAGLVALPIAGYATFYLMEESPFNFGGGPGHGWPGGAHRTQRPPNPRRRRRPTPESRESSDPAVRPAEADARSRKRRQTMPRPKPNCRAMSAGLSRRRRAEPPKPRPRRGRSGHSRHLEDDGRPVRWALRSHRHPAAGRGRPRPLRGIQDQPGALALRPIRSRPSRSMSTRRPIPSCAAR